MCNRRVRITGGMKEFVGKTGEVIGKEDMGCIMYRVRLDEPVMLEGVGLVRDDCWSSSFLKTIRGKRDRFGF